MVAMIFLTLWTGFAFVLVRATWIDPGTGAWERGLILLFPAFGLLGLWLQWPRYRRRRSLRTVEDQGTWYVWIEIDGTERRSRKDPTEDWDAEDGDGGGDGGGGD